jgi:hypothetical protein
MPEASVPVARRGNRIARDDERRARLSEFRREMLFAKEAPARLRRDSGPASREFTPREPGGWAASTA